MQISLKWVNELVNVESVNLDNLITKLTLGGFEVEEIFEVKIENEKSMVLDISSTANRSDSLCIQGISLEIAALLNESPNQSKYAIKNSSWIDDINKLPQNFLQKSTCSSFIAITVENLNNLIAPKWLKQKLIQSGISPENNLSDFQKYLILETGYAFEFYDLEQIQKNLKSSSFKLRLTTDKSLKFFSANNGVTYPIDESTLILKANELPLSIAGFIPSHAVNCSDVTKSILIEGSVFNAAKIRQQSRILGLRTERSSRYEKSLKDTNLMHSCYRLISLLRIKNPKLTLNLHTISQPVPDSPKTIRLNYKTIKEVLGPIKKHSSVDRFKDISEPKNGFTNEDNFVNFPKDSETVYSKDSYRYLPPSLITDALTRLQFDVNHNEEKNIWDVRIPSLRNEDIMLEIDLIEEIGRIYGFDNFLTRLPIITRIGQEDFSYQIRKRVTSCLLNLGLNELVQYSLVNKKTYSKSSHKIKLINPLSQDYSNLRSDLLPNLLKAVQENSKNDKSILEGFEYGHVFSQTMDNSLKEKEHIAGIFGGIQTKLIWSDKFTDLNWFEAKGRIEQFFQKLNLNIFWKSYGPIQKNDIFHPYRTSEIYLEPNEYLGVFGQINPIIANQLGISFNIYLFEFDFELMEGQIKKNRQMIYQEYISYPKIIKDLSFIIHESISFNILKQILYLNGSKFLIDINLLDEYKGKEVPKDHISLCLQFIFQSDQETLQTKTIETIIEKIKTILTAEFNVTFRE